MKITFIRPNMGVYKAKDALQPLAIAVLDGLTPPGVETRFYDDRIEEIPINQDTDIVAISVETFTARRAYQLAAEFRKRGIYVVMGGYHPTFLPEEALNYSDTVIIGEAEGIWEKVIDDFLRKNCQKIYRNEGSGRLENIKYDRSLFKNKKYAPVYPVQFSRGCRFSCDFCSISAFYGSKLRQRPVGEFAAEIESLGQKHIFIVDDNFYVDREKTKSLLRALIPLKVRWSAQVSIDIASDPELLELMEKSGCMAVLIGFESLDKRNLEQMGKGVNIRNNEYSTAIKRIRDRGIMIYGTFVFGYDFDTKDSFGKSLEFALESKLMLANFNPLMPMPGTRLYSRLESEGRLLYRRWWLDPAFRYGDAMFKPKGMSAEELTTGCKNARFEFNKYSSFFKRAVDLKANSVSPVNFGIFVLSNLISRQEIHKKQGLKLGSEETLEMYQEAER
ncbi:MAG: B12-binding domain-containing radical SAM protein [Ruminiclostridium sp.]|nr:B12-binding domain-containing radical SAM protein [Ruminiclostridium sp.]